MPRSKRTITAGAPMHVVRQCRFCCARPLRALPPCRATRTARVCEREQKRGCEGASGQAFTLEACARAQEALQQYVHLRLFRATYPTTACLPWRERLFVHFNASIAAYDSRTGGEPCPSFRCRIGFAAIKHLFLIWPKIHRGNSAIHA